MCIHTKSCVYQSRPPPIGEAIVLTRVAVLINEGNCGELNYALHVIGKQKLKSLGKKSQFVFLMYLAIFSFYNCM